MGYHLSRLTEREFALVKTVHQKYGVYLSTLEAKFLRYMLDIRYASDDALHDYMWPDSDGGDIDFRKNVKVHVCHLRKKLGKLLDLRTMYGQGYLLKRLGTGEKTMFDRK